MDFMEIKCIRIHLEWIELKMGFRTSFFNTAMILRVRYEEGNFSYKVLNEDPEPRSYLWVNPSGVIWKARMQAI
jgi:hypothetical protein